MKKENWENGLNHLLWNNLETDGTNTRPMKPELQEDLVDFIRATRHQAVKEVVNYLEELYCVEHKWKTQRQGGDHTEAASNEMVTFCEVCGTEKGGGDEEYSMGVRDTIRSIKTHFEVDQQAQSFSEEGIK